MGFLSGTSSSQSGQEKEEKKVYDAIMGNSGEGEASEGPGGKYYYAKSLPYSYYYDGKAAGEQKELKALAEDSESKYYYGKDEEKEGDEGKSKDDDESNSDTAADDEDESAGDQEAEEGKNKDASMLAIDDPTNDPEIQEVTKEVHDAANLLQQRIEDAEQEAKQG